MEIYFETFIQSLMAFAAFSLLASAVYVLNDLIDLELIDLIQEKNRPIVSAQFLYLCSCRYNIINRTKHCTKYIVWKIFLYYPNDLFLLNGIILLLYQKTIAIDVCILACLYTIKLLGRSCYKY